MHSVMNSMLVVDDGTQDVEVVSEMLCLEAHDVSIAGNGEQAVDQKDDARCDLAQPFGGQELTTTLSDLLAG